MRKAAIYRNGVFAGILTEENSYYSFRYDDTYFNSDKPPVSLTFPKSQQKYQLDYMFPFFSNMIAEGANLAIQSRYLKIDPKDTLSLLLATCGSDTIGDVIVKEL
jgi:serine/threonine-protein kinase HipA